MRKTILIFMKNSMIPFLLVGTLVAPMHSSANSGVDENSIKAKAGARLVWGTFPRIGTALIKAVSVDKKQVAIQTYNDDDVLTDNVQLYDLRELLHRKDVGIEVVSLNDVTKGMTAICEHLYGTMTGKVTHVYSNGAVELNINSSTNNCGACYQSGGTPATRYFSAVSGSLRPAYPCAYFSESVEENTHLER